MKRIRMIAGVLACGLLIGGIASMYTAPSAGARSYWCDNKIEKMERDAERMLSRGKISQEDYDKMQAEIAFHQELWGC